MGNVIKKLAIGLVVGAALFGLARALEFPVIFQMMFFGHAIFGAAIFMLLDAPSVKTMSGVKSVIAVVVFYIVLCTVYISGASMWPSRPREGEGEDRRFVSDLRTSWAALVRGSREKEIRRALCEGIGRRG